MILLLITLQIFSHTMQTIEAHELCENKPDIIYIIDKGVVCIPTDLIFIGDFEKLNPNCEEECGE